MMPQEHPPASPPAAQLRGDAVSQNMSRDEAEQFLSGLHVGMLGVAAGAGRGPLVIPVWYTYEPGGVVTVSTGRNTRKARLVAAAGRLTLSAQDEQPPYKYVSVEGPAVIEDIDLDERRILARRYLGTEGGDQFIASNPGADGGDIAIRLTPERWLTADFSQ
jgi:Pyridoxamine 5'-phosphate oxidase